MASGLSVTWIFALIGVIFLAWEWPLGAAAVLTVVIVNRPTRKKPTRTSVPTVAPQQAPQTRRPSAEKQGLKHNVKPATREVTTPKLVPTVVPEEPQPVVVLGLKQPSKAVIAAAPWRSTRVATMVEKGEKPANARSLPKRFDAPTPAAPQVSNARLKELNTILGLSKEQPVAKSASVAPWRSVRVAEKPTPCKASAPAVAGPSKDALAALMAALDAANDAKSMDEIESTPVISAAAAVAAKAPAHTPAEFRKALVSILKELAQHRNAAQAVGQVRSLMVPLELQCPNFVDILTRAMEERNGPVRRIYISFLTGLASGTPNSAFCKEQCLAGLVEFFSDVYEELAAEVPRLDKLAECELVPTLRAAFSDSELETALPRSLVRAR